MDQKHPTPFTVAIVRMVRDLFPRPGASLDEFEKQVEEQVLLPVRERLQGVEKELKIWGVRRLEATESE